MRKNTLILALMLFTSALSAAQPVYREEIYNDNAVLMGVKSLTLTLNVEFSGTKTDKSATDMILKRINNEIMAKTVRKYLAGKGFVIALEGSGQAKTSPTLCFVINLKRVKNKWSIITPEVRLKQAKQSTQTPWLAQVRSVTVDDKSLFDTLNAVFISLCGQFADDAAFVNRKKIKGSPI